MQSILASSLLVGIGGMLGALARFGLSAVFQSSSTFPWGTLSANLLGCFVIGIIANFLASWESLHETMLLPEHYRFLLVVGFCGGFTTLSSFVLESTAMLHRHETLPLVGYFTATLLGGFASFYAGLMLARWLVSLTTRGSA